MVSEKQEVQADEVEQEAPKAAPKTTRTRKPKATEQAKTEAAEKAAEAPAEAAEKPAETPAVQENTPETDAPEKAAEAPAEAAETPQANSNSLSVTNSGATTFCRVSGKTIATGQTVTISYKNAILKSKAKRNFEQLNELAGKKRFSVEG